MPIIITILSLFFPRIVLFCIFLATNWFSKAYETVIWPLIGFLFFPYTTLVYMAIKLNNGDGGWWLILLIIGFFIDCCKALDSIENTG